MICVGVWFLLLFEFFLFLFLVVMAMWHSFHLTTIGLKLMPGIWANFAVRVVILLIMASTLGVCLLVNEAMSLNNLSFSFSICRCNLKVGNANGFGGGGVGAVGLNGGVVVARKAL